MQELRKPQPQQPTSANAFCTSQGISNRLRRALTRAMLVRLTSNNFGRYENIGTLFKSSQRALAFCVSPNWLAGFGRKLWIPRHSTGILRRGWAFGEVFRSGKNDEEGGKNSLIPASLLSNKPEGQFSLAVINDHCPSIY